MSAVTKEPATLIGHSLGGGIVLQYTGTHPNDGQARGLDRGDWVRRPE